MKDLCKAMGIEWHEWETTYEYIDGRPVAPGPVICKDCGKLMLGPEDENPSPTDPAFCWRALTYMAQREDWDEFYMSCTRRYKAELVILLWKDVTEGSVTRWLLDPARFIDLADEWCREHTEKGE